MSRRFEMVLYSTQSVYHRDAMPIYARDLAQAEGKATRILRQYRLTKYDGNRWDRWAVRSPGSPMKAPVVLAHGTKDGTQWTRRDNTQAGVVRG